MKVAVYEYTATGDMSSMAGYQIATSNDRKNDIDVIRVSEWAEVEFTKFSADKILPEMVKNIDDKIENIKERAMNEVAELQGKKAELLALN